MSTDDRFYKVLAIIAVVAIVAIAVVIVGPKLLEGRASVASAAKDAVSELDPDKPWIEAAQTDVSMGIELDKVSVTRWNTEKCSMVPDGTDEARYVDAFYDKPDGTEGFIREIVTRTGNDYEPYSYTGMK